MAEALRNSVTDVLEKMFFVRSLDEDEAGERDSGEMLTAQLTFEGELPGSLSLQIRSKAARALAADFLGSEEEDLSDREVGEVICELANMICGSVLSRVESGTAFRLSSPHLVESPVESPEAPMEGGGQQAAGVFHGMMSVRLRTEASECSLAAEYVS
jgi:CheY-specific phosphatase CheX